MCEIEKFCMIRLIIHHSIYVINGITNYVIRNLFGIERLTPTKQWHKMERNFKYDYKNLIETHRIKTKGIQRCNFNVKPLRRKKFSSIKEMTEKPNIPR
jgi:hypothetical protein